MRFGLVVVMSALVSFGVTGFVRSSNIDAPPIPPQTRVSVPLQPPPLNLPKPSECTQAFTGFGEDHPAWSRAAVTDRLGAETDRYEDIELLDVDCSADPCVAWILWESGCDDPALAYRWWSIDGVPTAALWTMSRTFDLVLPDVPEATLQAVSVAPPHDSPEEATAWRKLVEARIDMQLEPLLERLGAQ